MHADSPSVAWDLSDLYASLDDPAIGTDCAALLTRAREFAARYRGRIAAPDCDAATLAAATAEFEAIHRERAKPLTYAGLMFQADTTDPARGALLQRLQLEGTAIANELVFFDLEVGRMPEATFQSLIGASELDPWRHYLEQERALARHHLTELEERLAEELSNTGARAFTRLFSEIASRTVYRVEAPDGPRELTQSEVLALLYSPERPVRAAAAAAITATLRGQAHVVTYIFNTLLQHKATVDRLRRYDYPEQARHESNEMEPEVIEAVAGVVVDSYGTVAEYYRLKARLLDLDQLTHYDRYAPLFPAESRIPWEEARDTVLGAFQGFTPRLREIAARFFDRRWIDADLRPGKNSGAFCSGVTPDLHPYVFMNYTGRPRDVMTLAHELGHAAHGVLASHHHYLDFHATLPLCETASVFSEMLVFERLQNTLTDPRELLALLAGKIEDTMATSFRQIALYRFEQAAHRARREEGELTTERYNTLWQQSMQAMFGDSLELGEEHAWWWLYIPHVFHTPFYVYAYACGELLVLSLYARYKREGAPFIDRYLQFLAAGGSRRPAELLGALDIDIRSREFWQGGADLIAGMVARARALADAIPAAEGA